MVSYTRARAEALGVACKVGLATRPVRVVILSIGLVFARGASIGHFELLAPAVYVLAALSAITVVQRILYVRKQLSGRRARPAGSRAVRRPRDHRRRPAGDAAAVPGSDARPINGPADAPNYTNEFT